MSSADQAPFPHETSAQSTPTSRNFQRFERLLSDFAERFNPILIKETRQALKSKVFVFTFSLLLIAGWIWSVFGTIANMPGIYYTPMGDVMLSGYYCILAVPVLIIVPFTAFRSLAAERDDGTYELLSITSLSARQIVTGKLSSAVLQMIFFYSALAPFIVFTYLLRGIDIVFILLLLFYTCLASILFSAVGLMFAGLSKQRNFQMLMTVVLLALLFMATFGWMSVIVELADRGRFDRMFPYEEPAYWVGNAALLNLYVTTFLIVVFIAAAQISFASDNRSTKIRVVLLVQTVCFVGWVTGMWSYSAEWEILCIGAMVGAFYWYVCGAFLAGECGQLSPRVKRSLPQTFAGRVFLTWFNPGSGTGYMFACANVAALCTLAFVGLSVQDAWQVPKGWGGRIRTVDPEAFLGVVMALEYFVLYLGIGRLILLAIPFRDRFSFVLPLLLHVAVAICACLIPVAIEQLIDGSFNYSPLQFGNWAWTFDQVMSGRMNNSALPIVVGTAAMLVFAMNLVLTIQEVEAVRLQTPQRVQEDLNDSPKSATSNT